MVNNIDKDVIGVRDDKGELVGAVGSKFRAGTNAGDNRENAVSGDDGRGVQGSDDKDDRVAKEKRGNSLNVFFYKCFAPLIPN